MKSTFLEAVLFAGFKGASQIFQNGLLSPPLFERNFEAGIDVKKCPKKRLNLEKAAPNSDSFLTLGLVAGEGDYSAAFAANISSTICTAVAMASLHFSFIIPLQAGSSLCSGMLTL